MGIRNIRELGDEILRKKSKPVEIIDDKIKEIIKDLLDTMHVNEGVGLAAPQIGILKQIVVVEIEEGSDPIIIINPVVIKEKGEQISEEGCLSLPNRYAKVKRPEKIIIEALNENGEEIEIRAKGLVAVAICHEIDHLKGELFIDKMIEGSMEIVKKIQNNEK